MIEPTWCRRLRLPPFAKGAKDGAPHCVGDASEIKSMGHPPTCHPEARVLRGLKDLRLLCSLPGLTQRARELKLDVLEAKSR